MIALLGKPCSTSCGSVVSAGVAGGKVMLQRDIRRWTIMSLWNEILLSTDLRLRLMITRRVDRRPRKTRAPSTPPTIAGRLALRPRPDDAEASGEAGGDEVVFAADEVEDVGAGFVEAGGVGVVEAVGSAIASTSLLVPMTVFRGLPLTAFNT